MDKPLCLLNRADLIAYIRQLEADRDRFKARLEKETKL